MQAGQEVAVYQKPYEYEDFEGTATLVNFIKDDPEMEYWEVRFEDDPDSLFTRSFAKGEHEYFIIIGGTAAGGYWGKGLTRAEAEKSFVEAGGFVEGIGFVEAGGNRDDELVITYRFTSRFEFAHLDEQGEDQADAWVDSWGRVHWSRCQMEKEGDK